MSKSRSPLVIIFITIFIDLVGFGIVIPILPLYAERFGASETVIGMLIASYSLMQFIFAPILGRLSDRVGRRPVLLLSLIGTSIGFLVMGLGGALWVLFLARIIDGVSGGNISTAQAYIADITPPDQRSRGMGLIGAAFGLGFIFGPLIGGVMSHISPAAPFLFAAVLSGANAVALYFLLPESLSVESRQQGRTRTPLKSVFEEAGSWSLAAIMATNFFSTVAFAMLTATYSLFANRRYGFSASQNAYLFVYMGLIGAVVQGGLLGRLVKVAGDKALAIVGIALFVLSLVALPTSASVSAFLVFSAGISIGNSCSTPTLNGLASKSVNAFWQGRVLGVMASVSSLARIIGPSLGGLLLRQDAVNAPEHYGRSPYWLGAGLMVIALVLAVTVRAPEGDAAQAIGPVGSTAAEAEPNA